MKKHLQQSGFSLSEMILTIGIMVIFGTIGSLEISHMKNYFLVQEAHEKVQSALQESKKKVLSGLTHCAKISLSSKNTKEEDLSLFFINEEWTPFSLNYNIECITKNNNKWDTSNFLESVTIAEENNELYLKFLLKDNIFPEAVALNAVDLSLHNIGLLNEDFELITDIIYLDESNVFYIPLSKNSFYSLRIFNKFHTNLLSNINIHFYNANHQMIANNDPSIIRIDNIEANVMSQETKSGDLEIVYQSPNAKAFTALKRDDTDYLAKDIQIHFFNKNEAEGDFSFFNAFLLQENSSQKNRETQSTSCLFQADNLDFHCQNQSP